MGGVIQKQRQLNGGKSVPITDPSIGLSFAALVLANLAFFPLLIWYKAREFRYFVNSTRYKSITLTSNLAPAVVVGLIIATYVIIVILMTGTFFAIFTTTFMPLGKTMGQGQLFLIAGVSMTIIMLLVLPLMTQGFLRYQLVKRFCRKLTIDDVASLEGVVQTTRPAPSRGEGFADALDVGAI